MAPKVIRDISIQCVLALLRYEGELRCGRAGTSRRRASTRRQRAHRYTRTSLESDDSFPMLAFRHPDGREV